MGVVLRRTVIGSGDWYFDNLSGGHHQSQVKGCCQSNVLSPVCVHWLYTVLWWWLPLRLSKCQSPLHPPWWSNYTFTCYPLGSNHLLKCFFLEKVWGNKEMVVFRKESLWLWLWEGRVSYGPSRRWLFLSCFQARLEFGMLDYGERLEWFMIGWNSWNISPFLFSSLHQTQARPPFHSQDLFS